MKNDFNKKDYWRAIILYGLNSATYKIALGKSLIKFSKKGKNIVTLNELAEEFFDMYKERLKNNMPQLNQPNRQTVMETIVQKYNIGKINRIQAIDEVTKNAFNDVIPRFHTVHHDDLPINFYVFENNKLYLTDHLFEVFEDKNIKDDLESEITSRWDLLEAAFALKQNNSKLINDIRKFYLKKGYDRMNITSVIPVLNGYQNDICFYCGEKMNKKNIHVDHVIPRQLVKHDKIWNLVLAHDFCNSQKSDALPPKCYIKKLIERNEHFINSNHPIKNKLINQTGSTSLKRINFIKKVYEDAKIVIGYTWEGIKGYNPSTDKFYKTFIRRYINS